MEPKISVIMPVLAANSGYLEQAIGSILRQTEASLELIVVEDPSESDASAVLASFDDPRIVYLRNEVRTGLVAQLNQGLGLARGAYVARMDADDIAEPERLAEQARVLDENPGLGVIGCQKTIVDAQGDVIGFRDYPLAHRDITRALRRYSPMAHPSVMMRTFALRSVGGYSDSPVCNGAEDYDLWWRMAEAGIQFANHPMRLLRYRIQPQQVKSTRLRRQLKATISIKCSRIDASFRALDIARLCAEICLLLLPRRWVMRLFQGITYRRPVAKGGHRFDRSNRRRSCVSGG